MPSRLLGAHRRPGSLRRQAKTARRQTAPGQPLAGGFQTTPPPRPGRPQARRRCRTPALRVCSPRPTPHLNGKSGSHQQHRAGVARSISEPAPGAGKRPSKPPDASTRHPAQGSGGPSRRSERTAKRLGVVDRGHLRGGFIFTRGRSGGRLSLLAARIPAPVSRLCAAKISAKGTWAGPWTYTGAWAFPARAAPGILAPPHLPAA
jgi:hypothetical protein